jgi:hypothetical protein
MGACAFNSETLSFAGTPVEQAMCLMRGMDATRNLSPPLQSLPPALADRVGQTAGLPPREALSGFLSRQNLEWDFAARLWQPVSRARDNDPDAPTARYFVIHDTSGPYYGHRSFPGDIDQSAKFNDLNNFACADGWGKAHMVVNRSGAMLADHDYAIPWRETKFEQAAEFGGALKGLFLHNELIQPRRAGARGGDGRSPDPAFTPAQYDRLALLYTIASVRAGQWLIPAFHAAIDAEIANGHDDPLNFDIPSFADSLNRLIERLGKPEETEPVAPSAEDGTSAVDKSVIGNSATGTSATGTAASASKPTALLSTPQSTATSTLAPPDANVTAPIVQPESSREQNTASAESCTTHSAHGHRRGRCGSHRARHRHRATEAVRSVDRSVSQQGAGARHRGSDLHARHARNSTRHGRA